MSTIVVTGAAGFIGRRLVSRLAAEGADVVAVDLRPALNRRPGVTWHRADLAVPETLWPAGRPRDDFVLVHLAWDMCRLADETVQQAQAAILAGLLEAWEGRGLAYVVGLGSAAEYGQRGGTLNEDDAPLEPLTPYGRAKRQAGEAVCGWARLSGVGLAWLRPFIVYGPGQEGEMAIPYAIRQARAGRRAELTDGEQMRDFVYVDDVAEAVARAAMEQPAGCHCINLGTGQGVRLRDVFGEVGRLLKASQLLAFGARPRRPGEPDVQVADIRRAREVLGWHSSVDWHDGVRRACGVP